TVGEMLGRVKRQAVAAQQHQDIPFEQVVELVQPVRSLAHSPLFQVMFSWIDAPQGRLELLELEVGSFSPSGPHIVAKFDMTLSLQESGGCIKGGVEYATALFERGTVERYLGYFLRLLEGMIAGGESQAINDIAMLEDQERQQVVCEWNATEAEIPAGCVHELFEEQVEKTPDVVAVVYEEASLSYSELNHRANQLAHYLRTLGVRPETRVAICLERRLELMVALLAVLKAGGAYVQLDAAYPRERLRYMLEDSAPVVLLTQVDLEEVFSGMNESLPLVDLSSAGALWREQPENNLDAGTIGLRPEHLAYVIYTSGSTGMPKGVAVQHKSLSNYLHWVTATLLPGIKRLPATSSLSFDACLKQLLAPLVVGQTVILIHSILEESSRLLEVFSGGPTALNCVPFLWQHIIDRLEKNSQHSYENLVRAFLGGEQITPELLRRSLQVMPHVQISNLYGPTETTANAVYAAQVSAEDLSLGKPIANTRIYVLDRSMQAVPPGVAGELYIGGAGLARGYLNRPDLTAGSFVPDPFDRRPGQRLYRTGDQGKWRRGGNLEFLGRTDEQVKIRGIRVELGEIEAPLREHVSIRDAVVVTREEAGGEKRLVAYYTQGAGEEEVGAEELRGYLSGKLPEYMVPAAYVRMERLPLTANGKLDRKALPAPEGDAYAVRRYETPEGEIETALAFIWADLTKVERVGRHDNFFELGGHSLLVTKLVLRIYQHLGVKIGIPEVFEFPELSSLAAQVRHAQFADFDSEEFANMMRDS
ncbi:MAG TPA: amino acid adenylation domain-containing protein, partial [Candidatus Angelobacter sp.]